MPTNATEVRGRHSGCLLTCDVWSSFFYLSAFTSIHLIATGVSCFLGAGLLSFLVYVYCQRFHKPSQESAVIHPTTPNHLNYKGNTTPKNEKYTPMEFKVRFGPAGGFT